jgi:hypothetical protein
MEGRGSYFWNNGTVYIGEFQNGKPHGSSLWVHFILCSNDISLKEAENWWTRKEMSFMKEGSKMELQLPNREHFLQLQQ